MSDTASAAESPRPSIDSSAERQGIDDSMARLIMRNVGYEGIVRGIAHEIRNPMQSMVFAAQTLAESVGEEGEELAEILTRSAERLSASLDHLSYLFSTPGASEDPVILQEVVAQAAALQAFSNFKIAGEIEVHLPSTLAAASGNARDIEDIVCLLLTICKESIGRGETGTISVTGRDVDGQFLELVVTDTASAVPEHLLPLFQESSNHGNEHALVTGIAAARRVLAASGASLTLTPAGTDGPRAVLRLREWVRGRSQQ